MTVRRGAYHDHRFILPRARYRIWKKMARRKRYFPWQGSKEISYTAPDTIVEHQITESGDFDVPLRKNGTSETAGLVMWSLCFCFVHGIYFWKYSFPFWVSDGVEKNVRKWSPRISPHPCLAISIHLCFRNASMIPPRWWSRSLTLVCCACAPLRYFAFDHCEQTKQTKGSHIYQDRNRISISKSRPLVYYADFKYFSCSKDSFGPITGSNFNFNFNFLEFLILLAR